MKTGDSGLRKWLPNRPPFGLPKWIPNRAPDGAGPARPGPARPARPGPAQPCPASTAWPSHPRAPPAAPCVSEKQRISTKPGMAARELGNGPKNGEWAGLSDENVTGKV